MYKNARSHKAADGKLKAEGVLGLFNPKRKKWAVFSVLAGPVLLLIFCAQAHGQRFAKTVAERTTGQPWLVQRIEDKDLIVGSGDDMFVLSVEQIGRHLCTYARIERSKSLAVAWSASGKPAPSQESGTGGHFRATSEPAIQPELPRN